MATSRIYIGGVKETVEERELEDQFGRFGRIKNIWIARKPGGFAFVDYEDARDAEDAVRNTDGRNGWRVELSRRAMGGGGRGGYGGGGGGYGGGGPPRGEFRCYECNEIGHMARDCRLRGGTAGTGGRGRSPPRRDYSPRRRDSPPRDRSPPRRRDYSPRRRDDSPPRRRDDSPPRRRDDSPPRRRRDSPPREERRDRDRSPAREQRRERERSPPRDASPARGRSDSR